MSVTVIKNPDVVLLEMERIINEANTALLNGSADDADAIVAKCKSEIEPLAKEYKMGAEIEYYNMVARDAIAKKENAMKNIITAASFDTKVLAYEYDESNGKVMKIDLVAKPVRIDLAAFDRAYAKNAAGKSSAANDQRWQYAVSKLNQLFCLDRAVAIGVERAIINKTYYLRDKAREIELGKTPTSNTSLLKATQEVVDMIIYEKNEKTGVNTYKVTSHDIAYLKTVYAKISSKAELSVTVMNDRRFTDAIVRVMKKIITNGAYGVDGYKVAKQKSGSETAAA